MKRISIVLPLLAVSFCLYLSCHKPDIPCKKYCQIKAIEDRYLNDVITTTYAYTGNHLLDSFTVKPAVVGGTATHVKISYNNQGKPGGSKDNIGRTHKLIYQNGHVVRVDLLGADNLFHPKYTFVYDAQGRIIERQEGVSKLIWEYEGSSVNFKRKLNMQFLRPGEPLEIFMAYEYEYDDKVNPMTTWPNTSLVPYYYEIIDKADHFYEPIPANNWTRQNVTANFRGAQLPYHEYLYTYQYDDVYPVKYDLLLLTRNPFISRVDTTRGTTTFTWNCTGDNNNYK